MSLLEVLAGAIEDSKKGGEMTDRGYCGIGVVNMKTAINYGTLFRSALSFGVDFLFLVGKRFKKQCSDTTRSEKHIPLFEYPTLEDFLAHTPYNCPLVGIEICDAAKSIVAYTHPERATYVLGQEDGSLPEELLQRCVSVIQIPTAYCLNVAVAGSIVLYDRLLKKEEKW